MIWNNNTMIYAQSPRPRVSQYAGLPCQGQIQQMIFPLGAVEAGSENNTGNFGGPSTRSGCKLSIVQASNMGGQKTSKQR